MQTVHGDRIDVLPGIGTTMVLRIVDSENRLAIARLTLDEAGELFAFAEGVASAHGSRHRVEEEVRP